MTEVQVEGGTLRVEVDQVDVSSAIDGRGYTYELSPGRVSYYLNDQPISEDEAARLAAQAAEATA